jgi:hypothetical protein
MDETSQEAFRNTTWMYSGPLGSCTLYLDDGGEMLVFTEKEELTGSWEIEGESLILRIPGASEAHVCSVADSFSELHGKSPHGMAPSTWQAEFVC